MTHEFRILGPIEAYRNGVLLDLGGPDVEAILTSLLLDANSVVARADFPTMPSRELDGLVRRLQALLGPAVVEARDDGYQVNVEPDRLDASRFLAAATEGCALAAAKCPREALERLKTALDEWRAPAPHAVLARHGLLRLNALKARLGVEMELPMKAATAAPIPVSTPRASGLVGRHAELARLRGVLRRSGVALVTGPAGIGKHALVEAALADALDSNTTVGWGHCRRRGAPPLWPWLGVARRLLQTTEPRRGREALWSDAETITRAIEDAHLGGPPPRDLDAVTNALRDFLLRMASRQRLTVVLFGLQWADVSSLELLNNVARHAGAAPLSIVATCRDVGPASAQIADATAAGTICLAGLGPGDVARLVTAACGARLNPTLVDALFRASEGNPLAAIELALLLQGEGSLTGPPTPTADLALRDPVAFPELVRRRMSRLPTPTARLLRLAAIMGEVFELERLADAAGINAAEAADLLTVASDAGLVIGHPRVAGRCRFAHGPVAEALADAIPQRHRDGILSEVGRRLGAGVAPTAPGTRQLDSPRKVLELLRAWDVALEHGQVATADEFAQRLWELSQSAGDDLSRMAGSLARGVTELQQGRPHAARAHLAEDAGLWEARTEPLFAGVLHKHEGVLTTANSAWAWWLLGDSDEAQRLSRQGGRLAATVGHLPTLAYAVFAEACVLAFEGDAEAVDDRAVQLNRIASEAAMPAWRAIAAVLHGWADATEGLHEGVGLVERALQRVDATGLRTFRSLFLALLADAYRRVGRLEDAQEAVVDGLGELDAGGGRFYESELLRVHGELALALASTRPAARHAGLSSLHRAVAVARAQGATALERRAANSLRRAIG